MDLDVFFLKKEGFFATVFGILRNKIPLDIYHECIMTKQKALI